MNEEVQDKVLVLGVRPSSRVVESYGWDELPDHLNVADYDVLIMDFMPFVTERSLATRIDPTSLPKPSHIIRQLRYSGSGALIVIGGTPELLLYRGERNRGMNSLCLGDLFPLLPHFDTQDSSQQIQNVDQNFAWYLDWVERWDWWIDADNLTKNDQALSEYLKEAGPAAQALNSDMKPLASTRFGKPIAFMLNYVATSATNVTRVSGRRTTRNNIAGTFGFLVWLPRMTKSTASAGALVLDCMLGIGSVEQAPGWSERYRMPQEEAALSQLESLKAKMQELKEQIRLAEGRLSTEQRFKKLLYEQGPELEVAVWEALEVLGATVHKPENNEDDGRLEDPSGRLAMLEVRGRRGSGTLDEVRQLHDWMDNAYHTRGGRAKASSWPTCISPRTLRHVPSRSQTTAFGLPSVMGSA